METEIRPSSVILPVKVEKKEYSIKDFEDAIEHLLAKVDSKLIKLFTLYSVRSGNSEIRDFLKNYENMIKDKTQSTEESFLITTIFSTIYQQLSLLEQVKLDRTLKEETVTMMGAAFYSHLKKFLS